MTEPVTGVAAATGPGTAAGVHEAQARLISLLEAAGFSDEMARGPSRLPGWSVGHLLTHIARNADSYTHMVSAAIEDRLEVQYPGGAAQREDGIDTGAGRPAGALVDDLVSSAAALDAAFSRVTADRWAMAIVRWDDQPWPLFDLAFLRWREVVLHTFDIGLDSVGIEEWPHDYVEQELLRQVSGLTPRLPGRQGLHLSPTDRSWRTMALSMSEATPRPFVVIEAPAREILAWLVGRHPGRADWPPLADWRGIP